MSRISEVGNDVLNDIPALLGIVRQAPLDLPWILTLTAGNSFVFQLVIYALLPILLLGQRFLLIDLGGWPYLLLLFLVVLVTKAHPTRAVASTVRSSDKRLSVSTSLSLRKITSLITNFPPSDITTTATRQFHGFSGGPSVSLT